MENQLTHIDSDGNPTMVDVGSKRATLRIAKAQAIVVLPEELLPLLTGGELTTPKGPVFQTAILAGILASKKTGDLIPLCHPLGLDNCRINIQIGSNREILIECIASVEAKTGVEMEAMVGASVAALTIYDMCKAFSQDIVVKEIKLMEKSGGKRDFKRQS